MDNPYTSSPLDPVSTPVGGGVTPDVVRILAATKPWVRFCGVLGFIGSGFMFLAALLMLLAGGSMFAGGGSEIPFAGLPVILAVVYVVAGLLYLFPSMKLWKYGTHIANLMSSSSAHDLEAALDAQRSFWKFVSIMIMVAIGFYIIMFIIIGIVAGAGVMSA